MFINGENNCHELKRCVKGVMYNEYRMKNKNVFGEAKTAALVF